MIINYSVTRILKVRVLTLCTDQNHEPVGRVGLAAWTQPDSQVLDARNLVSISLVHLDRLSRPIIPLSLGLLSKSRNERSLTGFIQWKVCTGEQLDEVIREPELVFISLAVPEVCAWRRDNGSFRDSERLGHSVDFTLVEVADQLHVHDSVSSLAEIRQVPVLVLVAGAHDNGRVAPLRVELCHVIPNRCAHVRAELAGGEVSTSNSNLAVNQRLELLEDLGLVDDDAGGATCFDVLPATLLGPCAAIDGLTHADVVNNRAAFHLLGSRAKSEGGSRVDASRDRGHAGLQPGFCHVFVEFLAFALDPLFGIKPTRFTIGSQLGDELGMKGGRGHVDGSSGVGGAG
mmetsp:Transcript_13039/g.17523  ORF Transcript_13039/g.17523 Transcript_13039/m.17523 type:complete len:345 (+) Transcript_13039:195-1229(+)